MSYYKVMKGLEDRINTGKTVKKTWATGSGLLGRVKMPSGPLRAESGDVTDELAAYIDSIRKQKQELMNGKK